ncbi:hypothetical protein V3391_06785 [Luteimonas sp. SMYT11W]|uniref:HEPN domain-containing protein n=1 Tax=Luteimonas flava TaxID=3115822 RepID=A0ABU7WDG3_9GAMM
MPIDDKVLVDFAQQIVESASSEVEFRCSIGRAYYAGFHSVIGIACRLPESDSFKESSSHLSHHEVGARLRKWDVSDVCGSWTRLKPTASTLSDLLNTCRASRVVADYRLNRSVNKSDAKMQIARVKQIRVIVKQLEAAESSQAA